MRQRIYVGDVATKSNIQLSDPDYLNVTANTMVHSIQRSSYAGGFTLLAGDGGPFLIDTFSNIFGLSTAFWAVDYSRDAQNSSLIVNSTLHDLNMVLTGVMYQPVVGQDRIIVHAVDSKLAAADPETIYVSISPIEHLPHIVINKQQLIVHEDSILGITDVSVEIGNYSAAESQAVSQPVLQALLQVSHGGALAVQTITTSAPHVDMVQSVAIVALPVGNSITGGSFSLGLDLSVYGLGFVNTPIPIQFNAIGERFEENSGSTVVGRQSGQSVQSILESIPALQTLGIRVSVRVFGDVFSSNPPSHDEFAALTPESQKTYIFSGRKWQITFLNAPYDFPQLQLVENNLFSLVTKPSEAANTLLIKTIPYANALAGFFNLYMYTEGLPSSFNSESV